MAMGSHKNNHPPMAYLIGLVFMIISLCVGAGVVYHLTLSHHGPGLLRPVVQRHEPTEMPVLTIAQRQAKLDRHSHFHNIVQYPRPVDADQPQCLICHFDLPHQKNKRVRALLNMHTPYLACESCHLKRDQHRPLEFQWISPVDPSPQGPFAGTRYDAKTGYLAEVDDKFSKITPFLRSEDGRLVSAVERLDQQAARDFMQRRDQLSPEQRLEQVKVIHRTTEPKGPGCQTCHAKEGVMDFNALTFSDKRVADLVHLNITGMLARYESWYLPDLLSETRSNGNAEEEPQP